MESKSQSMDRESATTVMQPVASVKILAYNHGPYIQRAIEGVLQQKTSFPFELIIGEDCSTDNTREIALKYEQLHPGIIRVITSERNVGGHENSRRCEQACRGRYLAYCEGDDYWTNPEKLEKQVKFLESHPDYAMVHTAFRMHYIESGKTVPEPLRLPNDLVDEDAFNEILSGKRKIWGLTVCIRRSIYDEVIRDCPECYDTRFLMGDTQRWLEIAHRGKIKYLPETTATRQVLLESATQSKNPARVLRFAISNKDVYDYYIAKYGCSKEAEKCTKTRCAFYLLSCSYEAGNAQVAKEALNEYNQVGVRPPLAARLYYYGSKKRWLRKLVCPVLATLNIGEKICRRFYSFKNPK